MRHFLLYTLATLVTIIALASNALVVTPEEGAILSKDELSVLTTKIADSNKRIEELEERVEILKAIVKKGQETWCI